MEKRTNNDKSLQSNSLTGQSTEVFSALRLPTEGII